MRTARAWPFAAALFVPPAIASLAIACSLTTSLDGLAGAVTKGDDPGARADADAAADGSPADGATEGALGPAAAVSSCDALKRSQPNTPDGPQRIDPDGDGPAPSFVAYCDMTNDDGGWMLVTADLLAAEAKQEATVTRTNDARGGVVMRVYVNSPGCGGSVPPTRHRIFFADDFRWTRVRVSQTFAGSASCWHIFGGQESVQSGALDPNLVPFENTKDVVRDAVRMGGSKGNAFDGDPVRCDNTPENFWASSNGNAPRSATVILRRRDLSAPSGLSGGADCSEVGTGATSTTWWEYHDIYVK